MTLAQKEKYKKYVWGVVILLFVVLMWMKSEKASDAIPTQRKSIVVQIATLVFVALVLLAAFMFPPLGWLGLMVKIAAVSSSAYFIYDAFLKKEYVLPLMTQPSVLDSGSYPDAELHQKVSGGTVVTEVFKNA
jgi:hypothetical protein